MPLHTSQPTRSVNTRLQAAVTRSRKAMQQLDTLIRQAERLEDLPHRQHPSAPNRPMQTTPGLR